MVLSLEPDVITAETPDTGAHPGYSTWADGSRLYDSEGYPLPNKMHQHFGERVPFFEPSDTAAIESLCRQTMFALNPTLKPKDFLQYEQTPAPNGSAFGL
ncbi:MULTISPECIES: hypothetical protein [unclassified Pseudarthrobacter]|uniref:hypothetical protein n=1 Tax=unclassified Pseudarthrobacter TaxID=2647000 RepID=UPI003076FDE3